MHTHGLSRTIGRSFGAVAFGVVLSSVSMAVDPDGRAINVVEGIRRARFRDGYRRPALMRPGRTYRIPIDLHATSYWFAPGHQIRVEVSSSNFPRFERNLNTGGNNYDETEGVVAHNVVHHSTQYPSRITLTVVNR